MCLYAILLSYGPSINVLTYIHSLFSERSYSSGFHGCHLRFYSRERVTAVNLTILSFLRECILRMVYQYRNTVLRNFIGEDDHNNLSVQIFQFSVSVSGASVQPPEV